MELHGSPQIPVTLHKWCDETFLPPVDAPKFVATTSGKPPGPDLSAAPFPFGIVASTGDNGTSFPRIIIK